MYQQGYGSPNMGNRHITKGEVYQYLQQYCYQTTNTAVTTTVKIEEYPQYLRHACVQAGHISYLPQQYLTIPLINGESITVYYYFCSYCGKLFVCEGFM